MRPATALVNRIYGWVVISGVFNLRNWIAGIDYKPEKNYNCTNFSLHRETCRPKVFQTTSVFKVETFPGSQFMTFSALPDSGIDLTNIFK